MTASSTSPADMSTTKSVYEGEAATGIPGPASPGQSVAIQNLLEKYYPRICAIVRIRTGLPREQVDEDSYVFHATMATALLSADGPSLESRATVIHWLASLAEGIVGGKRSEEVSVERPHTLSSVPEHSSGVASTPEGLGGLLAAAGSALNKPELLIRCLHALPEKQREIIVTRCYCGAGWSEVARMRGLASGDVARVRFFRAIGSLKSEFERRTAADD